MIKLANVAVIDDARARAERTLALLGRGGYGAEPASGMAGALALHPDLILIGQTETPLALAAALRADEAAADVPLVLLAAGTPAPELCTRALETGVDELIADGCDDTEFLSRIRPLVRLATMRTELRLRATVARTFGVAVQPRADHAPTRPAILVAGDAPAAVEAALSGEAELVTVATLFEAEDMLIRRNFDAAVLSYGTAPEGVLGFCGQLRHNPRLFNLPVVLLAADGPAPAEMYRCGASRVLSQPTPPPVVRAVLLTLVRRQQMRWGIRGALGGTLVEATRDAETGTYSRAFVEPHLAERLRHAAEHRRHLSVIFFNAPSIQGIREHFGEDAGQHLTQQLGQWITGLLRAEDLVGRTGPHEFCAVLPDTPLAEAEVVVHRIAGVLAYTDFAVRDVYQPVKVWVQVGATHAHGDDDLLSLMTRARLNLG